MVVHTSVYRMLGIKGNHAEEFQKANIVIKVVSLKPSGKLKAGQKALYEKQFPI